MPKQKQSSIPHAAGQDQAVKTAFANNLRKLMKEKSLTQAELARRAHMTRDNVCTYVNARVYPRPDKICRLAKALEVSVAELIPKSAMLASIDEQPAMDTRLTDKPGMVWLRIAAEVPLALALEIMDRIGKAGGGNGEMRPA